MLIKICGISTIDHALAAATAGADLIGLVFAPSRRRITLEAAVAISTALRAHPGPQPQLVGLFVNESVATINQIAAAAHLDLIQLNGDEDISIAASLIRPVIMAVRMDDTPREAAWLAQPLAAERTIPAVLVDAHVAGAYGGTGVRADWQRAARLAACVPIMLAGGLTPTNVAAAIATVQPQGVDVSSGVETDGHKDELKIEAFIAAARTA